MPPSLDAYWLAEAIRLREEHWGPLDDTDIVRKVNAGPQGLPVRILARAQLLARREKLDILPARWRQGAALTLAGLALLALLAGAVTALGALGDGSRPVNVLWALGALLGLHTLTFLAWMASFGFRANAAGGLGKLWLWATRKVARGPDAALVPQALLNLLAGAGALRWVLGAITHLLWLAGLGAALAALLAVLSTASYRFIWATTLLDAATFVRLTHALGWLPMQLGFPLPDPSVVRASDGGQALPAAAQVQWSIWLIGVIVAYGVLPRLLAGIFCAAMALRRLRALHLDLALPGYAALRDRLAPVAQFTGIDRPVDPLHEPRLGAYAPPAMLGSQHVLVGVEWPSDLPWPPAPLPVGAIDAGRLDTREQRQRLLDALANAAAARLLIVCDARQTPDRGTLALIAELAERSGQTRVWPTPAHGNSRHAAWRTRLTAAGLPAHAILNDADDPLKWLETAHG